MALAVAENTAFADVVAAAAVECDAVVGAGAGAVAAVAAEQASNQLAVAPFQNAVRLKLEALPTARSVAAAVV